MKILAMFQTDGINIFYKELGDPNAPHCIAFFNGALATTNSWEFLHPVFERQGFRVILHDFRGQLKSDKPPGPYTFKQHAADARALFNHLGVERVHLVGASYGGAVAMRFAVEYPDCVASLSVMTSLSETDPVTSGFILGWKTFCDTGDGEAFFWGMAPSIYSPAFLTENRAFCEQMAKATKKAPPEYLAGQKTIYDTLTGDVYITDRLSEINCPTLVVSAELDILTPPKFSQIIAAEIPGAEYLSLPNCGHACILEKPDALISAVFGFVMKHCL